MNDLLTFKKDWPEYSSKVILYFLKLARKYLCLRRDNTKDNSNLFWSRIYK